MIRPIQQAIASQNHDGFLSERILQVEERRTTVTHTLKMRASPTRECVRTVKYFSLNFLREQIRWVALASDWQDLHVSLTDSFLHPEETNLLVAQLPRTGSSSEASCCTVAMEHVQLITSLPVLLHCFRACRPDLSATAKVVSSWEPEKDPLCVLRDNVLDLAQCLQRQK